MPGKKSGGFDNKGIEGADAPGALMRLMGHGRHARHQNVDDQEPFQSVTL